MRLPVAPGNSQPHCRLVRARQSLQQDSRAERERYSRDVKGVCPVGEYLVSGDGEVYSPSSWWGETRDPNLRAGQGRYRRWDGSGELVSEEEGRTGYIKITDGPQGCAVSVDVNLGKRIHAVYKTSVTVSASDASACDL